MTTFSVLRRALVALPCLLGAWALPAQADDTQPIKLLVGFAPGGSTDTMARHLALALQTELGRTVIVENRPGAGGQIAAQALKAARPDGTTLFLSNSHTVAMIPLTVLNPGYDPTRDFTPIGLVAVSPDVFVVNPARVGGAQPGLADFARWAKANPGVGSVGVPAPASAPDFAVSLVSAALNSDLKAVPYRGDGPVVQDVAAGHVPAGIGSVGVMLPQAKAGKIRIVAVNGTARLPLLPDVPTYAELGVKGYEEVIYTAVFAPAGLPAPLVQQFNAAITRVVRSADFGDKLAALGISAAASTPGELAARVAATHQSWTALVKAVGYKPQ
jgi:tripartite-type tricarboxylate transporter receptor subunit TctC